MSIADWASVIVIGVLAGCLSHYYTECKRLRKVIDIKDDQINTMREYVESWEWENSKED